MSAPPTVKACTEQYNGFFGDTCVTCGLVSDAWHNMVNLAGMYTPKIVPLIWPIIGYGALFYLFVDVYYRIGPSRRQNQDGADGKGTMALFDALVRLMVITPLFAFPNYLFSAAYNIFIVIPVGTILEGAAYLLASVANQYPSLARIVATSCSPANYQDIGGALACIAHVNEAAIGWAGMVLVSQFGVLEVFTPSFWFALFLLIRIAQPILEAPSLIARASFRGAATMTTAPIVLGFWVLPGTKGIGRYLIENAVYVALTVMLSLLAVSGAAAGASAILKLISSFEIVPGAGLFDPNNMTSYIRYSGPDPFDCVATAAKNDHLTVKPWEGPFWVILITVELYKAFLGEAMTIAGEIRDRIFKN